ncbi:hypothetical protein CRG98_044122 [Punica granatum]|uniref:Uncharacterized protein n=1 Tax=Punica granatum TaxID=22663 RepID=A0A2I0HUW5_PUNGR|nr:hypothetical protein CRG98_044122 [Punica granatum]
MVQGWRRKEGLIPSAPLFYQSSSFLSRTDNSVRGNSKTSQTRRGLPRALHSMSHGDPTPTRRHCDLTPTVVAVPSEG